MQFSDRLEIIRRAIAEAGVERLIAFSTGEHQIERPDPIALLCGVKPLGEAAAVLRADGRSVLLVSPAWDEARATARSQAAETIGTDDLMGALEERLRSDNLSAAHTGVIGLGAMPHATEGRLAKLLGGAPRNVEQAVFGVGQLTLGLPPPKPGTGPQRATVGRKTADEIARARKATEIAEAGHEFMLKTARPGMRQCDLAWEMKAHMMSLGADDCFMMMTAAAHNASIMPSTARPLEAGDVIIGEATPSFRGQFSQICRTASLGEPSAALKKGYGLVREAMLAGIAQAKPGNRVADVCKAIDAFLTAEGYGDYCRPPYMRRRGHGLGITTVAPGNVATSNEVMLEEDMFFVIHPNQYLPETGYLLCGEPTLVTAKGGEHLTKRVATLETIPV